MKQIKQVGFSNGAMALLDGYGAKFGQAQKNKAIDTLANQVSGVKRGKFAIDSMDDFAWFNGIGLSFIRNWNTGEALILTTSEAQKLDDMTVITPKGNEKADLRMKSLFINAKIGWRS